MNTTSGDRRLQEKGSDKTEARILVVDDDESIRELYASILRRQGFQVVDTVRDGLAAVKAVQEDSTHSISAIVMDYRMPLMNGLEATKIIKQADPRVRVILCSAFDDLSPSELKTFDLILKKPVSSNMLADAIKEVSRGASSGSTLSGGRPDLDGHRRSRFGIYGGIDSFAKISFRSLKGLCFST